MRIDVENISGRRGHPIRAGRVCPSDRAAFTLLEVMIALTIFFVSVFSILELTSQSLGAARRLQRTEVDITSLAAELSLTNRLEEGTESGDFGDLPPGVNWHRTITEISSNGLFQVDFVVLIPPKERGGKRSERMLSFWLYRPDSTTSLRGGLR